MPRYASALITGCLVYKIFFKNWPVYEFFTLTISSGVPVATTYPPLVATLGAKINDIISCFDDIHIMLYNKHGIARSTRLARTSSSFATSAK